MFTLTSVFFSLSFIVLSICLTVWTVTTYIVKQESKMFIQEELSNIVDISKMLFVSIKSLVGILVKYSFLSDLGKATPTESNRLDEQPLKIVPPIEPVEAVETRGMVPSIKETKEVKEVEEIEEDTAMSSFSKELIEVITEEEEKVA